MKKVFSLALISSIICSNAGCIGSVSSDNKEPVAYATKEKKQKLAEVLYEVKEPIEEDFFETVNPIDFSDIFDSAAGYGKLEFLSQEERAFWAYLGLMRKSMAYAAIGEEDVPVTSIEGAFLNMPMFIAGMKGEEEQGSKKALTELLSSIENVIRYEKQTPWNFDKLYELAAKESPEEAKKINKEAYLKSRKLILERMQEMQEGIKKLLAERESIQPGESPREALARKKKEAAIAEYTINFLAPELYPAELILAEFALGKYAEESNYSFPTLFMVNGSIANSARLENEKPLPNKLDLVWYSIVENKVYALETPLPFEKIKEKIISEEGWDSLLFALSPYGQVYLYAHNQINQKREELAKFEAKEIEVSLEGFRQAGPKYENPSSPAKDWTEYQQKALSYHEKAAAALKEKGLPAKDFDFWADK